MIVIYHEERRRFEAITSWTERYIPKENRWRWDPDAKRWWAPSDDIARRLAQYAQGSAEMRLIAMTEAERESLADSTAANTDGMDINVPAPAGLDYLPYQKAGIFYALGRRGTLIADEMGLGKTIQAIGTVNMLPTASRVLIVCPASLRLNWQAEWLRWHTGALKPVLLDHWPRGGPEGKALIVSYDSVKKWHPMIAATQWDILCADEAHLCKDDTTRRAKALFGGKYRGHVFEPIRARRKLFLSGTPIVNRPQELWPLVKALDPDGMGSSRIEFFTRYGVESRLDELHLRLRSRIMVRRLKADVLTELPPKRRQIVLLDVPDSSAILAAEAEAISMARARIERTNQEIAGLPHAEQVMRLRECRHMAMSEISRVRRETAVRKLPAAIEHIRTILAETGKAVVFGHHHDVVDGLFGAFSGEAVVLDGRTDQRLRQGVVARFQTEKGTKLFVGGLKAAGLGLTLTAASTVVFCELDWTPAAMMQAEDRLHRIGQRNHVQVQHLVIDGSIDSKMAKIILTKQAMMDSVLDGGPRTEGKTDILEEVLQ